MNLFHQRSQRTRTKKVRFNLQSTKEEPAQKRHLTAAFDTRTFRLSLKVMTESEILWQRKKSRVLLLTTKPCLVKEKKGYTVAIIVIRPEAHKTGRGLIFDCGGGKYVRVEQSEPEEHEENARYVRIAAWSDKSKFDDTSTYINNDVKINETGSCCLVALFRYDRVIGVIYNSDDIESVVGPNEKMIEKFRKRLFKRRKRTKEAKEKEAKAKAAKEKAAKEAKEKKAEKKAKEKAAKAAKEAKEAKEAKKAKGKKRKRGKGEGEREKKKQRREQRK